MNVVRVAAALILIAVLTGTLPAAAAAASNDLANSVSSLTDAAREGESFAPRVDASRTEPPTTIQDIAIFGLISLGVLGLLWIRRHTSEL